MNGAHDLGGMDGFGPIDQSQTTHFPAEWERKVFGLTLASGMLGKWNLDLSRFAREQMDPGHYLTSTYYEHWLHGLETLLVQQGLVTKEELESGRPLDGKNYTPVKKDQVAAILEKGGPVSMETEKEALYKVSDTVKLINRHPTGHTRLPRYLRGHSGEIIYHHGAHVFPDSHSQTGVKEPAHLYTVAFSAQEIWGAFESEVEDSIMVDVFEPYIAQRI